MIRSCRGWLTGVALVGAALSAGACKKSEQKPAAGDPKSPSDVTAEKPAGSKTAKPDRAASNLKPGVNADDLSLLPRDAELVAGLNFAQLQQSALWKKFAEPRLMNPGVQADLVQFKAKCGFDPMFAVKSLSIGMKGLGAAKPEGVIVIHGPDKAKSLSCLDKMKDEAAKDGSTITQDGDVVTISSRHGDAVALMFVSDDTAVVVVGPNASKDGVKAVAAGGSALKTSPAFVDMYNRIKTGDSVWMLINGKSKAFDQVQRMGIKPLAVYGSFNVSDGLSADLRMRVDSPAQASQLATGFQGQIQPFVPMVDQLDIAGDGPDVRFSVSISEAKLQQLVKTFGGMLGGLAGGMGGP